MDYVDIHPHIISDDETRYPPAPLFGKHSDWSPGAPQHRPSRGGGLGRHGRPDAVDTIGSGVGQGLAGLRIFTGGSTKDFDPSELEDERAFPAWELMAELNIPMCIQTGPVGLPQVVSLARRFPTVPSILDHLGRPDVLEGPPYANAASLFELSDIASIYLKLTPRIFGDVRKEKASAETFFPKVVAAFGADRMAWGSNFPTSPGSMSKIKADAEAGLASLSDADREWIFSKTALTLYPQLKAKA